MVHRSHLAVFFCVALTAKPALGLEYLLTDLGNLGGSRVEVVGMNNRGQVIGWGPNALGHYQGFRTNAMSPIDPGSSDFLYPLGINDDGWVVGQFAADGYAKAYRTPPDRGLQTSTDYLGALDSRRFSSAYAINALGQVVGSSAPWNAQSHAFRTTPGGRVDDPGADIGTLGGGSGKAVAINSSGQVAGSSTRFQSLDEHAFRTRPNAAIDPSTDDLGTLGGAYSHTTGMNDSGQVIGYSQTADGFIRGFCTTANGLVSDPAASLGTLGGSNSWAYGINSSGQVVGSAYLAGDTAIRACLWDHGRSLDLTDLLPPSSGWVLLTAKAINDMGIIAGEGQYNGQTRAFLLVPVPEPSTAWAVTLIAFVLTWRSRLRY